MVVAESTHNVAKLVGLVGTPMGSMSGAGVFAIHYSWCVPAPLEGPQHHAKLDYGCVQFFQKLLSKVLLH
jgi:hypothetical protein